MANKEFVSLNELAKQSNINKSKLSYYVSLGLIRPNTVVGKMQIFKKKDVLKTLTEIKKWQNESKSLKQIKDKLDAARK